jgi:hypothetical protein
VTQFNAAASILCYQDWAILCLITPPPVNIVRNPIRKPRGATKAIIGQSRINHGWDFVEAQGQFGDDIGANGGL